MIRSRRSVSCRKRLNKEQYDKNTTGVRNGFQRASGGNRQAYSALKALGRDPTRLRFEQVHSPTEAILEGRSITLFGTNNYLGLTFDSDCIRAVTAATHAEGPGTTGSRIANGSYGGHFAPETEIVVGAKGAS